MEISYLFFINYAGSPMKFYKSLMRIILATYIKCCLHKYVILMSTNLLNELKLTSPIK